MKAVNKYKSLIQELRYIFANLDNDRPSLSLLEKEQAKVMHYANRIADEIKEELIGDGKKAEFMGRLEIAFYELGADPNFAPYYFPLFDEALFELPSKDEPDRNRQMLDTLINIYGDDAAAVMVSLQTTAEWANYIVKEVSKMLDDVCRFVGYTPGPQQGEQEQQPQQGEQEQQNEKGKEIPTLKNTDKERLVFGNALMKEYMSLDKDKYKWHKPYNLLAYMCGRLYCGDRVIDIDLKKGYRQMPRTAVKELFSGIDVANNRYSMKKPPKDYWIIDDFFIDKGGVSR